MPALLCQTLALALVAPIECTLREILSEYGWDTGDGLLLSLAQLSETLGLFHLQSSPPIGERGLDDVRVLSSLGPGSLEVALQRISNGETEEVEFKSSLLLDLRRFRAEPGQVLNSYRLERLLIGVLKSIAALANSSGGTLYVGVEDNGDICGLTEDFTLADPQAADYDHWNLYLRQQVEARFFDGQAVNSAFRTARFEHQEKPFVEVQVAQRSELSFMRKQGAAGGAELYIRSGTRSIPIEYQNIQKHFKVYRTSK